jgi:3-methyl-2-oxobutanoate hydroxymethyltransferase
VALTAWDYAIAQLLDAAGVDIILVGDSLAMVTLGYQTTLPVTLEEMLHHAKAVRRGVKRALLMVDLPFLSYQESPQQAIHSAGRVLKETGAQAVKLEGGYPAMVETVQRLTFSWDSGNGSYWFDAAIGTSARLPTAGEDARRR